MATETIDHTTLHRLVETGAVRVAHVVGLSGGWALTVKFGLNERPLAEQSSDPAIQKAGNAGQLSERRRDRAV